MMTSFNPQQEWTARLRKVLLEGVRNLKCTETEAQLLGRVISTEQDWTASRFQLEELVREVQLSDAEMRGSLYTIMEPDDWAVELPRPLLGLTLRWLVKDMEQLQAEAAGGVMVELKRAGAGEGGELRLCAPLPPATVWRRYWLAGVDYEVSGAGYREYRRLWLYLLLQALAEWGVESRVQPAGRCWSELVLSFGAVGEAGARRTGAEFLAKCRREIQRSRQQVAAYYGLPECQGMRPAGTSIRAAETDWEPRPKYVVIDGVEERTGRSTTMMNLALSLAQDYGQRVLCVTTRAWREDQVAHWKMAEWQDRDGLPEQDESYEDFARQIMVVEENLAISGYWFGYEYYWEPTLRSQCGSYEIVLIEGHCRIREEDEMALRLADLVLLSGGLVAREKQEPEWHMWKYAELRRGEQRPELPVKLLWHESYKLRVEEREAIKAAYRAAGVELLKAEIRGDRKYRQAVRARRPVVQGGASSRAVEEYRAAAEELLRWLYQLPAEPEEEAAGESLEGGAKQDGE